MMRRSGGIRQETERLLTSPHFQQALDQQLRQI